MKHLESNIQKICVKWFRYQYRQYSKLLFSVPNGGKRNAKEAAIMKGEGTVSGVSDLILLVPKKGFNTFCIEIKTEKGTQTDNQKAWQKVVEREGNKYSICRSFEQFRIEVENYLN